MKTATIETEAPAALLTVTVTVTVLSDGSVWVPISAVAAAVGGADEYVANRMRAHKVKPVIGPDGVHGLDVDTALDLVAKLRRELDEHSDRWQAYVTYREAKKREAAEARARVLQEERENERKRSRLFATKAAKEAERRAAEEAAQAAAAKAAREGAPVPFEKWSS